VKTAPKPVTVAGTLPPVPGIENVTSVIVLSNGVNRRRGLNVAKVVAYVGLMSSRLSVPPVSGACVSPMPGVVNVAPRVFSKTVNGVTGGVPTVTAPPPSQLISRRPLASGPGLLALLGSPSAPRNASTVS
jgi:hypothetical protein